MKKKRNIVLKEYLEYGIFAIIAFVFLLIFSAYTSPLYPDFYSWDSPFFMMAGKMMNSGVELYSGIFDDKGPVIFLINALGYLVGGRSGVFLLEWLFLFLDICIMKMIMELFGLGGRKKYLSIVLSLIFFAFPLANGNTCEEYNLPFIFLSFYFMIKDLKDGKPDLLHSFFYGIGISICALTRITNGISIFAIVFFWIIYLLRDGKWKELLQNIAMGLLGIVITMMPFMIYFVIKQSLYEMIFDVFIINISYASNSVYLNNFTNVSVLAHMLINFSPLIAAIVVFWVNISDRNLKTALVLITVLNIPVLTLGGGYNHYFAIVMPIVLLICVFMLNGFKPLSLPGFAAIYLFGLYFILAVRIVCVNTYDRYISADYKKEFNAVRDDFDKIPENERDSILGYTIAPKYYLMGDVLPCFKYCAFQDIWVNEVLEIKEETDEYFESTPPLWLVIEDDYDNQMIMSILEKKYDLKISDDYLKIYRLKTKL